MMSGIILCILGIVGLNIGLWKISNRILHIICTMVLVIIPLCFWNKIQELLILYLFLFTVTYINLCVFYKKRFNKTFYSIFFVSFSVFFILWITVMFGKYYYDNHLIDVSFYKRQIGNIVAQYRWYLFPKYEFQMSIIFFNIGIERYFVLPENISFKNVHFLQFFIGLIIDGTIFYVLCDLIITAISPNTKNNSVSKNSKIELASIKLYSEILFKEYTNCFYKEETSNMGCEVTIKNNTNEKQVANILIVIYNNRNIEIKQWIDKKELNDGSCTTFDFDVGESFFSKMKEGRYKMCIYIDNKKIKKISFKVK